MNPRFQAIVHGTVFAIALGFLLHVGRDVLVPVVFSILVVYIILGLARLLSRVPVIGRKEPGKLHYAVSILLIVLVMLVGASLLLSQVGRLVELAPDYLASLLATLQAAAERLGVESDASWTNLRGELLERINLKGFAGAAMGATVALLASLVVVSLYVAFLLIEQQVMPGKLERIAAEFGGGAQLQRIITDINARVGTYLVMKTLISLLTGLVSYLVMAFVGLEFAGFWAILIVLLNFIPYIGSWLSVLLPVAFAVLQFGDIGTVLTLAIPLVMAQFLIGNFLDPYLMANSLNLSGFAILISLAAWTALWGIPGAFLAVPITASIAMVLAEFKGTRPIAILLSRSGQLDERS